MKFYNMIQKREYRLISLCLLLLAGSFLFSCKKMDDTYKSFIKNGEIVYTGRVDSLKAYSGRNRVKLTWLLVSDPKITKNVVYWNDKADSMVLSVTKTANTDTVKVIIPNLAEQTYTFQVYTYDNYGHRSVKAEVIGTVYGDNFLNTIQNRPLNTSVLTAATNNLAITWWGVSPQAVSLDMTYNDISGVARTVTDKLMQDPTVTTRVKLILPGVSNLPNFKKGNSFQYRTGYKPVPDCIDTFYTPWTTVVVP